MIDTQARASIVAMTFCVSGTFSAAGRRPLIAGFSAAWNKTCHNAAEGEAPTTPEPQVFCGLEVAPRA